MQAKPKLSTHGGAKDTSWRRRRRETIDHLQGVTFTDIIPTFAGAPQQLWVHARVWYPTILSCRALVTVLLGMNAGGRNYTCAKVCEAIQAWGPHKRTDRRNATDQGFLHPANPRRHHTCRRSGTSGVGIEIYCQPLRKKRSINPSGPWLTSSKAMPPSNSACGTCMRNLPQHPSLRGYDKAIVWFTKS